MASRIKQVDQRAGFPALEDRINEFWKKNKIFEKSVEQRPLDNKYTFVDGPPFVSGMPHPAHLFVSTAKDIIPRYWTMKGKRVRRVFGWDCHGLPIEAKVNAKFGITSRKQLEEEFGIDKYVAACREYVQQHITDWRWYIEKIGRWADMDNAYHTMYPEFNESVIWAFKQFYEKGLVYKGKRTSLFSTDTSTPVSEFEVAMDPDNYREVDDLSVFVKFQLTTQPFGKLPTFMLAWTTTPWTIPSNFALAVNKDFEYTVVKYKNELYVLATDRVEYAFGKEEYEVVKTIGGTELNGLEYEPVYDFFVDSKTENDFKVYLSEHVTNEDGTGVLHVAPAFGEVDFEMGKDWGLSDATDIDEAGNMTVGPWEGTYLRDASPVIAEDMKEKGNLLRSEMFKHRLPFYRGENPLIYMVQDAYYIKLQDVKKRMLELNEGVNWIPEHFKYKRFAHTVETSPDWGISRTRYWATILPLWESKDGDKLVMGSIEEMTQYTDQIEKREEDGKTVYYMDGKKFMLHRDFCDKLVLKKDGKEYFRVSEVMDNWLDAGSVPFAEYHYPFEHEEEFKNGFPADFIVEYTGQIRAWFNVLFRVSTILFDREPFKNVICHGVLSGSDGRKMSKSFGNFTDPKKVLNEIGAEAFRLYSMSTPNMVGGDINWSDDLLNEQVKTVLIPLWNTYRYLAMYAHMHDWSPKNTEYAENNILDRWLKSYMNKVTKEYSEAIERYDLPASTKLIAPTIDNISTWWIRRSRDRFANGDKEALQTLFAALVQFAYTFAPHIPFVTEEMYQNLVVGTGLKGAKESVHLDDYPVVGEIDEKLLEQMERARKVCSLGLNIRDENRIKLRQPLSAAFIEGIDNEQLVELVKEELNVKTVKAFPKKKSKGVLVKENEGYKVGLDINLTPELIQEGLYRDLVRSVQNARKQSGLNVGEKAVMTLTVDSAELAKILEAKIETLKEDVTATKVAVKVGDVSEKAVKVGEYRLDITF